MKELFFFPPLQNSESTSSSLSFSPDKKRQHSTIWISDFLSPLWGGEKIRKPKENGRFTIIYC